MKDKMMRISRHMITPIVGAIFGFSVLFIGCGNKTPDAQAPGAQSPTTPKAAAGPLSPTSPRKSPGKITLKIPKNLTPEQIAALDPDAAVPQESAAAAAPAAEGASDSQATTPAPSSSGDPFLDKITGEKDLFALYAMKQEYEARPDKSEAVLAVFSKRQNELVAEHKPQPAINGCLDFVAFDFKRIKGEEHQLRWYYVVTDDIKLNWILLVGFTVDPSHIDVIPEDSPYRKDCLMFQRIHVEQSKINTWKKGEHKVLTLKTNLKPVPYSINMQFYQWFADKPQISANVIRHGWCADAAE